MSAVISGSSGSGSVAASAGASGVSLDSSDVSVSAIRMGNVGEETRQDDVVIDGTVEKL